MPKYRMYYLVPTHEDFEAGDNASARTFAHEYITKLQNAATFREEIPPTLHSTIKISKESNEEEEKNQQEEKLAG